jgi:hypothetical protein
VVHATEELMISRYSLEKVEMKNKDPANEDISTTAYFASARVAQAMKSPLGKEKTANTRIEKLLIFLPQFDHGIWRLSL